MIDCYNAEENKNATVGTNTFIAYGQFCFCWN
jgi:hypothetical protein